MRLDLILFINIPFLDLSQCISFFFHLYLDHHNKLEEIQMTSFKNTSFGQIAGIIAGSSLLFMAVLAGFSYMFVFQSIFFSRYISYVERFSDATVTFH